MVQDKEVDVPLDTVADVMGKYLLENMLCRNPSDRMALRDAVVYADQIGAEVSCLADWYIAQSARERVQFCTIRGPLVLRNPLTTFFRNKGRFYSYCGWYKYTINGTTQRVPEE